jgi:hypothetical protein
VPQRAHALAGDGEVGHAEELHVRHCLPGDLLHNLQRVGTLNLIAVDLADDRAGTGNGALVAFQLDVIPAGLAVVLHPVVHRRPADQVEAVLLEMEQYDVADDVAVVVAGDELLGLVRTEVLKAIDPETLEHLRRVRPLHVHIGHVVRLVEQDRGLAPGALFVSPVRELRRHDGIDVRAGLRLAQQFHWTADGLQHVLEALVTHSRLLK